MAYFPELSPYVYDGRDPAPNMLNVGWLSNGHDFRSEPVAPRFVATLAEMAKSPTNLYRGSHLCEFCPAPPVFVRHGREFIDPPSGTAGNGEIRVQDPDGIIYVAPVLIVHYVTEHQYSPPQAFIEAVLRTNDSSSAPNFDAER